MNATQRLDLTDPIGGAQILAPAGLLAAETLKAGDSEGAERLLGWEEAGSESWPAAPDLSAVPATPDEAELAELTDRFAHRVRFFVNRVERRFGLAAVWRDDLISAGYWGLLKALRNRRADAHEHELSAYVSRRVEGAVIDEARGVLTRNSNQSEIDPADLDAGLDGATDEWTASVHLEDPEEQADRAGRWRAVESSFEELDDGQRELLIAYASGRSLAELARRDGASPARLQSRMNRIARQVRARAPELRRILRHEI